jgi:hypothetical protein
MTAKSRIVPVNPVLSGDSAPVGGHVATHVEPISKDTRLKEMVDRILTSNLFSALYD